MPTSPTSATATAPVVVALPRPDPWALPTRRPEGDISGIVEGVVTALNEQRAAEAQALAEQAAAQQPSNGGSTGAGTNTGGGSTGGGTSNGGGGQNPPPPPAAFVDQLGFTASSAVGGISVSASVHTTGSMNVTVQCTSAGTTINLAGPSPLDGSGSYSGSFTGLAPGTYQISCAVPGQLSSSTKNITVYE